MKRPCLSVVALAGLCYGLFFFFGDFIAEENPLAQDKPISPEASLPPNSLDPSLIAPEPSLPTAMQGRISLDLRNIEVVEALKFLAMKAGINIITTKNVTGRVIFMVENAPVQDVFDIMLRSNGLAYIKQGDIYNVMTEAEYHALFGRKFTDPRQVKIFKLKYAIPDQILNLLGNLKSEVGRVLVELDSGTVVVMDTPENIRIMEETLMSLEQKNTVRVFNLKYARAKEVEDQLKTQVDAKRVGTIKSDERSNQLIVQALPERMEVIERLIAALDRKTKEVLIDTKIIRVNLSDKLSAGIEWEGLFDVSRQFGTTYVGSFPFSVLQPSSSSFQSRLDFLKSQSGIGAYPFSGNTSSVASSTKITTGERLHVGIINSKRDFDLLIKYLQTLGKTQILSNPKLVVINNQEAKIHVGAKQAYVTTTTTTGQALSTVSEQVTFVDVGIQLSVTPTINDEGYVTMKVKPEVSSVISTLTTPSGNQIPIIDTSLAETTVMVKDGVSIILGGLRKEEKTSNVEQVPLFSKIPLLGALFRSSSKGVEKTELLVMLTPHIVSGDTLVTGEEENSRMKPYRGYENE